MRRKSPRRSTAKQIAWRQKFAELYGGKKRQRRAKSAPSRRGETMARRKSSRRSSSGFGGFGMNKLLKGAVVGIVATMIAPKVGLNIDSKIVGGAAGYMLAGGAAGAIAGAVAPQLVGGIIGSSQPTVKVYS